MNKFAFIAFVVLISLLLSSCNLPADNLPATSQPVNSTETQVVATEAVAAPIDTPTPASEAIKESIFIAQPDLNSQISSPVQVQGVAEPTFEQNLVVKVTGADGGVLAMTPTTIQADVGQSGPFSVELSFSVSEQQPGRVSVYSTSAVDGGIVHLSSAEVLLLPGGSPQINIATADQEDIHILEPNPQAQISGGVLQVSGYSDYYFEANLGVVICGPGGSGAPHELCGTADNVIAQGFATIDSADIGLAGPFSGELAYTLEGPTQARVIIFAASARDGGLLHASSVAIELIP